MLDGSAGVRGWFLDPVPPGRAPVGTGVCFGTQAGRVGVLEVTAVPDPGHLMVAVTVRQLPS
ncbi:hypothetical protein ACF07S_31050 [Streptomyces sp. NPDC016640]|uniref:hypothetical protein n=1 Tax=Streptomyces sp. NPDC016640 TaxID=3364969 RepID=UPI003701CDAF